MNVMCNSLLGNFCETGVSVLCPGLLRASGGVSTHSH